VGYLLITDAAVQSVTAQHHGITRLQRHRFTEVDCDLGSATE
jgi:hypothetical protein